MRRLILQTSVSIDGYVAALDGSHPWARGARTRRSSVGSSTRFPVAAPKQPQRHVVVKRRQFSGPSNQGLRDLGSLTPGA